MQDAAILGSTGHSIPRKQGRIRFTGSGSEFFRIWVINLLLTLLTFGLYWPFARARRLTYFHNQTEVLGDVLGFHGDAWKMFRGHVVLLVVAGSYAALSYFSPAYEWIALVLMALVWPALWHSALGFRMRNTSWRGVRFNFVGNMSQAYKVMLPLFAPAILMDLLPVVIKGHPEAVKWMGWSATGIAGMYFLLLPWFMAHVYRFQHGGYCFAQERSALSLETPMLYWLFMSFFLVFIVTVGVLALSGFVMVKNLSLNPAVVIPALVGVGYFLSFILIYSLAVVKTQNLLWSNTASRHIRLNSDLSLLRFLGRSALNWLLIVLTLGLYWPFAAVRMVRMQLEAITVDVDGGVDAWTSQVIPGASGVLGDASGDYWGMDMGL